MKSFAVVSTFRPGLAPRSVMTPAMGAVTVVTAPTSLPGPRAAIADGESPSNSSLRPGALDGGQLGRMLRMKAFQLLTAGRTNFHQLLGALELTLVGLEFCAS